MIDTINALNQTSDFDVSTIIFGGSSNANNPGTFGGVADAKEKVNGV